jgi:hypothetical protein
MAQASNFSTLGAIFLSVARFCYELTLTNSILKNLYKFLLNITKLSYKNSIRFIHKKCSPNTSLFVSVANRKWRKQERMRWERP